MSAASRPAFRRGSVDRPVGVGHLLGRQIARRRQPAVRDPAGQPQHPRPVRPEPDPDRVGRCRTALGPDDPVVLTVDPHPAAGVGVPDRPDDLDRLRGRLDRLTRGPPLAAHRHDRVPERARSEPELEPAAAEQVEARRRPGQDRRRAEREIRHVRGDRDLHGLRGDVRHQRPGVEERRLVRMVLEGDQIQPELLAQLGELDHPTRVGVGRGDERAEGRFAAVVGHPGQPATTRSA